LILVIAATAFFATWGYPLEDAAMIFNYSEHIAAGEGVVYVPGGERVDGASDLLMTFILAGAVWLGLPVQMGAALLNGLGVGITALLIFLSWSRPELGRRWPALAAVGLFLVTTPVLSLGASGFLTPAFAAMVTLTAYLVQRANNNSSTASLIAIGISVALAGMDRIEGFVLAGLIVLAEAVGTRSFRLVAIPAATAGLVAVAWFSWRWSYFDYPLPNPFYKKGGLHLSSLKISIQAVLEFSAPWIPILFAAVVSDRTRRRALSYILLVALPWSGIWMFLSNEMNITNRFQFPIAPVLAVLCGSLIVPLLPDLKRWRYWWSANEVRRASAFALALLVLLGFAIWPTVTTTQRQSDRFTAMRAVDYGGFYVKVSDAIRRARLDNKELLVSTEAGMVAFRSGLPVVDLWGLNDKRIAHSGLLSSDQIQDLRPDILFTHLGKVELLGMRSAEVPEGSWGRMNYNLFCFAAKNGFAPVAVWAEEADDWFVILAKSGTPLADRLRTELADVKFKGSSASAAVPLPAVRDCPLPVTP
jgi:hypothetical protein